MVERTGQYKIAKGPSGNKDVLVYTIRCREKFYADTLSFNEYPFEKSPFKYRFEIPNLSTTIKGEKIKISFDYYPTVRDDTIAWKGENVDNLPEHDIDFSKTNIYVI